MADFIAQPWDPVRVGDFLVKGLQDPKWTEFRAAVAFVRSSGTQYLAKYLSDFARRPGSSVTISVGADLGGSTYEGVKQLVDGVHGFGKLWVYKNTSSTFHPKVFLFKNANGAEVLVGSGNLTKGGLFENSEAFVRHTLNFASAADAALFKAIEIALDRWAVLTPGVCFPLDHPVLDSLLDSGDLPKEAAAKAAVKKAVASLHATATSKSPFKSVPLPKAPPAPPSPPTPVPPAHTAPATSSAPSKPGAPVATITAPALPVAAAVKGLTFGITLQKGDAGIGQTTPGTEKRSPEVFIPLAALDQLPSFWNWKSKFVPGTTYKADVGWRAKATNAAWIAKESKRTNRKPRPLNKLDWTNVVVRLTGHAGLLPATIWFNPRKKDIRIRQELIRSAGKIGDILLMRRAPPGAGYDYDMEVVPKTSPTFGGIDAKLTTKVSSKKRIGYF